MKRAHTWSVLPALVATLITLGACSSSSSVTGTTGGGPAAATVTIQDFMDTPSSVTIKVGQTVQWNNNGPSAHTTTSDTGVWDSGSLSPGSSFRFTFNTAGTFHYHCMNHPPSMYPSFIGSVTVTP
jgi:plastocyanin